MSLSPKANPLKFSHSFYIVAFSVLMETPENVARAWDAARFNNIEDLQKLVPSLVSPNAKVLSEKNHCHSLLMSACARGSSDCIKYLLESGATPDLKNFHGYTAFHWAAFTGRPEAIPLLLERGADIEARTADGKTPLHIAAFRGNRVFVDRLLEKGADLNAVDADGWNAFRIAALANQQRMVGYLREKGIIVDELDAHKKGITEFAREHDLGWLEAMIK